MTNETIGRFAFRATPTDIQNIEKIAMQMRTQGNAFATRTDAVRESLARAAEAVTVDSEERA
jgi:hypothetical protein